MASDDVRLTKNERMQIEAACRADYKPGWVGMFPARDCINAEVARIVAARVEAAEQSRDALIEKVKRLQDQIARASMEPGQDRQKAMHAYAARAETAERERDEALERAARAIYDEADRLDRYAMTRAAIWREVAAFVRGLIRQADS